MSKKKTIHNVLVPLPARLAAEVSRRARACQMPTYRRILRAIEEYEDRHGSPIGLSPEEEAIKEMLIDKLEAALVRERIGKLMSDAQADRTIPDETKPW